MEPVNVLQPMFAMFALTTVVWVYMYAKRIPFLQSLDLEPNEITPTKLVELSPPAVSNPSDNLKNLFEMPVLFYAGILTLHVTEVADTTSLGLAWAFVALRVLHSAVHCTINVVLLRFGIYALSSLCLFVLLGRTAMQLF